MENKKNVNVNLERYRRYFFLFGLVTVLSLVIAAFNWSSSENSVADMGTVFSEIDQDQMKITRQDMEKQKPVKQKPEIVSIKEVSDEEVVTDTVEFSAEIGNDEPIVIMDIDEPDEEEDIPVVFAEHMPEYPGGKVAMLKFLFKNIKYPTEAVDNEVEGTVYLRFVVSKTGAVGSVQLVRGVDPLLDNEALRVVKLLKNFKPAMQNGKTVSVWYSVPISFYLSK